VKARDKMQSYFQLAERYRQNGQYEEAKETMVALLRQQPEPEEVKNVFLRLAQFCFEQSDFQGALTYWNRAAAVAGSTLGPTDYEFHGNILVTQYRNAELSSQEEMTLDEAIESYRHAATLNPDAQHLASIYLGLGMAYRDNRELDTATDYFHKALALQPQDKQVAAECHLELGLVELWDHENPEKAISLLQLGLEISPLRPPSTWLSHSYWILSHALVQIGRLKEAIAMGQKSLAAADPDDASYTISLFTAHSVLGWAYYHIRGKEDQAIYHYTQALALEEDSSIYRDLGELYFYKDEFEQALEMFKTVLSIDPDYPRPGDIYDDMGVCLARLQRYEEALACLEMAQKEQATLSIGPYQIYKNMGWSYWHLGRYDEAAVAFKTALNLMYPKDKEYRQIEGYLRQVQFRRVLVDSADP
jgi:tetratricopeptide (TPR) repeat protein